MSVIVWNGTDLVMAAIIAGAIALGAVIMLFEWFCKRRQHMSVDLYRWTEDCEGQPCPGDCDLCERSERDDD